MVFPPMHRSYKWLFPSGFQTKNVHFSYSPCTLHAPQSHPLFECPNNIWWREQLKGLSSILCNNIYPDKEVCVTIVIIYTTSHLLVTFSMSFSSSFNFSDLIHKLQEKFYFHITYSAMVVAKMVSSEAS